MTQRPLYVLAVFGALGVFAACSLTVPSEDDLFGGLKSTAGRSGSGSGSGSGGEAGEAPAGGDGTGGARLGTGGASAGTSNGAAGDSSGGSGAQGGAFVGEAGVEEQAGSAGTAGGGVVVPPPVYGVQNPSFEKGSLVGWTITPKEVIMTGAVYPRFPPVGDTPPPDGSWQLSTWLEKDPYAATITQVVKVPEDGTYTLSAFFTMHTGFKAAELFARNCGGAEPVPLPLPKVASWQESRITGIEVVGGECEIGFSVDAVANQWLNADLFKFEKEP